MWATRLLPRRGGGERQGGVLYVAVVATAALLALLVLTRLLTHAEPEHGLGGARRTAADARHALALQQRRLASFLTRGSGASAVGCPGPPVQPAELVPARDAPLVLVTGGAGFIGSVLVGELLQLRYSVRVLDNLSSGNVSRLPAAHPRLELRVGDVTSPEDCAEAMRGVAAVVHLAAFSRVAPSLQGGAASAAACQRANVEGTLNVLEAARAAGVKRVVYAGACASCAARSSTAVTLRSPHTASLSSSHRLQHGVRRRRGG
jgi:hypothetical protein